MHLINIGSRLLLAVLCDEPIPIDSSGGHERLDRQRARGVVEAKVECRKDAIAEAALIQVRRARLVFGDSCPVDVGLRKAE